MAQARDLAHGMSVVSTDHATVTLLSEQTHAEPRQTLWFGLRFELAPHWHVYWRNPGASGAAPVIHWTLPGGWDAGEIHWPVPKRIRVGPLTNFGYEGTVTFLVPVRVPAGSLSAGPLHIAADAEWLSVISSAPGKQGHVSPAQADKLTQSRIAAPHAVILDPSGKIGRTYGAETTPHMYIIDGTGKLVYMGGIDSITTSNPDDIPQATQYVRAALREQATGKGVSMPVTRPYGCSVKY